MAIPAEVTADFIVIESEVFAGLQVLFHVPAGADGLHHEGQGRVRRRPDQVVRQLTGVVEAAAHHEPMALIHRAPMHHRQARPVKETLAFGAQALREALPIPGAERLLRNAGHISQQDARAGLDTDDFGGGHRQRVGVALLLQEVAQARAVAIDGIGHHPADGQVGLLSALDHPPGQFRFRLEGDVFWDVSGEPAWQIGAPIFRQIQLAVDEGVALLGDVGEKNADLAIFHFSSPSAMLDPDASRMVAPFREAAFINDEHRERGVGSRRLRRKGRWGEGSCGEFAQFIANAFLVPAGTGEQALHPVRSVLSGMLSDLPAILARDLAENRLQVEQAMLVGFRTSEVRTEPLMELLQAHQPAAQGELSGPDRIGCGMVRRLHAFLAFDGAHNRAGLVLLACHIGARKTRRFSDPGNYPRKIPGKILGNYPREKSGEDSRENSSV